MLLTFQSIKKTDTIRSSQIVVIENEGIEFNVIIMEDITIDERAIVTTGSVVVKNVYDVLINDFFPKTPE